MVDSNGYLNELGMGKQLGSKRTFDKDGVKRKKNEREGERERLSVGACDRVREWERERERRINRGRK